MDQAPQGDTGAPQTQTTPTAAPVGAPAAPTHNVVMGVLSYLSILVLIPLLTTKDDPFVKFHIKQGFVLLVIGVVLWLLGSMMYLPMIYPILMIAQLGLLVLIVLGIVNAVKGDEKELPLVGQFAKHFNF